MRAERKKMVAGAVEFLALVVNIVSGDEWITERNTTAIRALNSGIRLAKKVSDYDKCTITIYQVK